MLCQTSPKPPIHAFLIRSLISLISSLLHVTTVPNYSYQFLSFSAAGPRLWHDLPPGLRWPGLRFLQTIFENKSLWRLKRLVSLSAYRRYINKCIHLSIYLHSHSMALQCFTDVTSFQVSQHLAAATADLLTSVANIPRRSTMRASSCGNIVVPWTRRRIDDRDVSVAAPRAWNRLRRRS